jgi:flagellar hook-associated protein 3 FlgL
MRIATATAFDASIANLQRRQESLSLAQTQLTSGKRVFNPSDDPAAAARIERASTTISLSNSRIRALDVAKSNMQLGESALKDGGELLQQARELLVQAGGAGLSDAERLSIADGLRGLRDDLLGISKRSDGNGRYLFGGQGSDGSPLQDTVNGVQYAGTTGQLSAGVGDSTKLSLDGQAVWLQAPDPATPLATVSVFDTLDTIIGDLQLPKRTGAQVAQTVTDGLKGIDICASNLSRWRSRVGEALNRADTLTSELTQTRLDAQTMQSDAQDLDMVQALSSFQSQQTGYDAALKMYSIVQRMSLFDYIK